MKIIEQQYRGTRTQVMNVEAGKTMKFLKPFHEGHNVSAIFMKCAAPSGYRPEYDRYGEKIPVVNLRTGRISYVAGHREVTLYNADVSIKMEQC